MRFYWVVGVAAAVGLGSVWLSDSALLSTTLLAQGSKSGGGAEPGTPSQPALTVNGSLSVANSGLLNNGSLANAYPFEVSGSGSVTLDLQSPDFDTYLYIFDTAGNLVEENDDRSESDFNALLTVSLEPGSYIALTSSYGVLEEGSYDLDVTGTTLSDAVPLAAVAFAESEDVRLLDLEGAIARMQEPSDGPWRSVLQVYRGGATGSGTVMNADGLILTNYHVIEDELGEEPPVYVGIALDVDQPVTPLFQATIERSSSEDDLALLQVTGTLLGDALPNDLRFQPLTLGDVSEVNLGDPITVIGFPGTTAIQARGASYLTLTQGVISAILSRYSKRYDIISDVTVNSGNSGGAALNSKGELIAIPTGTVSDGGGSDINSAAVLRSVAAIPDEWLSLIGR